MSHEGSFPLWETVALQGSCPPFLTVYEDESVLVCQKAPGIPVQSASLRTPDLENMLRAYFGKAGQKCHPGAPFVIHRLDQPVQGLLVFAKTPQAAASLSRQAQNGQMKKEYCCVCRTEAPLPREGRETLTDYLLRDGRTNTSRAVPPQTAGAKKAVLAYEVLDAAKDRCLLHVKLQTGRHHQIRVQLARRGLPVWGDKKYGTPGPEAEGGLKLCAFRLTFAHPVTGKTMLFALDQKEEDDHEQDSV